MTDPIDPTVPPEPEPTEPPATTEVPTESGGSSDAAAAPLAPAPSTTEESTVPESSSGSVDPTPGVPSTVPDAVAQRVVAGIDSSKEQGNRVIVTDPITRENPLEPI